MINSKTFVRNLGDRYETRHDLTQTQVKMPPNLSMSTGFCLFPNSNFLTTHEHVANSYIDAFMYIHLLCFAEDSYQESKPGNEKRKSEVSDSYRVTKHRRKLSYSRTRKKTTYNYSDPGGTLEKNKQPKTLN